MAITCTTVLGAFLIGTFCFAPSHLAPHQVQILGFACALLAGLSVFFLTGTIRASAEAVARPPTRVAVRASGGTAVLLLVLFWWFSSAGPVHALSVPNSTTATEATRNYDYEIKTRLKRMRKQLDDARAGIGNVYSAYAIVLENTYEAVLPQFRGKSCQTLLFELEIVAPQEDRAGIRRAITALELLATINDNLQTQFLRATKRPDGSQDTSDTPALAKIAASGVQQLDTFLADNGDAFHRWQ